MLGGGGDQGDLWGPVGLAYRATPRRTHLHCLSKVIKPPGAVQAGWTSHNSLFHHIQSRLPLLYTAIQSSTIKWLSSDECLCRRGR